MGLSVLIELPKRERFCERFHSFCSRKNEILKLQFQFLPFLANPYKPEKKLDKIQTCTPKKREIRQRNETFGFKRCVEDQLRAHPSRRKERLRATLMDSGFSERIEKELGEERESVPFERPFR